MPGARVGVVRPRRRADGGGKDRGGGSSPTWLALHRGGKTFYTTPIKALSNQKFGDFLALHGAHNVGLLTGDNSINGAAPIVVMTTEVLRNMIYERLTHA